MVRVRVGLTAALASALILPLAGALLLPRAAAAGPPGKWTAVSPATLDSLSQADAARRADGELVAEWAHAGTPDVLESVRVSAAGAVSPYVTTSGAWEAATNPGLVHTPSNDFVEAWFGAQGLADFDGGLYRSQLAASATSWTVSDVNLIDPSVSSAYASSNVSTAWSPNQSMVFAVWDQAGYVYVVRSPGIGTSTQTLLEGGSNALYPNVACDPRATGSSVLAAWASQSSTHPGVKIAAVDPATGAPGTATTLPGSVTTFAGTPSFDVMMQRTALVAQPGGSFAVAYPVGYPSTHVVRLWHATTSGSTGSIDLATGSSHKSAVALAVEPDSARLWAAWADQVGSKTFIRVRRSNSSGTRFGATVTLSLPSGASAVQSICAEGGTNRLDIVALLAQPSGHYRQFHTQVLPGLTVAASPGSIKVGAKKTVTIRVGDVTAALKNALVKLGSKAVKTNSAGKASFKIGPFKKATTLKFIVSRSGYTTTSLSFKVKK